MGDVSHCSQTVTRVVSKICFSIYTSQYISVLSCAVMPALFTILMREIFISRTKGGEKEKTIKNKHILA